MPGARETGDGVIVLDAEAVATAAKRLRETGFVLVLARNEIASDFLPRASDAERASARQARDAVGHCLRRQIARAIAAGYTGHDATDFSIANSGDGQPRLSGPGGLHLSFASRGGLSLVGIAGSPIGVDLEGAIAPDTIPWNMLRPDETEALRALPEATRAGAFLDLWTGKEATLKALGTGLRIPPEALHITHGGIVRQRQDPSSDGEWRLLPLQVSWSTRHDVFHNTFRIAVALLSKDDPDPFEPGQS